MRKIGPGWREHGYNYALGSPLCQLDPQGREAISDLVAFDVGIWGSLLWQIGENAYKHGFNLIDYQIDGRKAIMEGVTDALATQAAESMFVFAGAAGFAAAASSISSGALVTGGGNLIEQAIDKGVNNVDLNKSAASVLFALIGGIGANKLPAIMTGTQSYPAALRSFVANRSAQEVTSTVVGNALDALSAHQEATSVNASQATKTGGTTSQTSPPSGSNGSTSSISWITIPRGATLSGLAHTYGTSVSALLRLNPSISDPNLIYSGAQLRIR